MGDRGWTGEEPRPMLGSDRVGECGGCCSPNRPSYPSPPDCRTDSIFRPEIFWKPRSLGLLLSVVSAVTVDCREARQGRRKVGASVAAANSGSRLSRRVCVVSRGNSPAPSMPSSGAGRRPSLRHRFSSTSSTNTTIIAPATPPTTPPAILPLSGGPGSAGGGAVDDGADPVPAVPVPPPPQ